MNHRRGFWTSAGFATASILLSGVSCTPDERTLGLRFGAAVSGDAGSNESAAGASESNGSSGSAGDDSAAEQGGDAGAADSSGLGGGGSGGTNAANGGFGGSQAGASTGGAGDVAGNGGTSNGGASGGSGGSGGAALGPCADSDHNGVDDCSESLIQNSTFDSNVTPWTSGQWNSSNAHAAGTSGSLLVLNDLPTVAAAGFNLKAAEQCIQVTGALTYRIGARVMIPPGQGSGMGGLNLWIFANDGCEGTFVTSLSPATTQVTGAWTQLAAEFKMPIAARSMVVRLAATRPFAQEKLQVLFDDIVVKQKLP